MDGFPEITEMAPRTTNRRLALLYRLLNASIPVLFRLPEPIESEFRGSIRTLAYNFLHNSVYGLVIIYLLVVAPVLFFSEDAHTGTWFWWAVFPIGVVLLGLWLFTRMEGYAYLVERVLGCAVWICLSGTLFAALKLDGAFLGYVAGFESVYIVIIAFSVLRIRVLAALVACLSALLMTLALVTLTGTALDWVSVNLFFVAPVVVGLVNGYIQESTARRDFLRFAYQQSQTTLLRDVMLAGDRAADERDCLSSALAVIGENMDWLGVAVMSPGVEPPWELEGSWLSETTRISEDSPDFWHLSHVQDLSSKVHDRREAASILLPVSHLGRGYCLAMPVSIDAGEQAVLLCWSENQRVRDTELLSFMQQVTDHIGRFLDRIRQKQRLQEMALHDSLTGLFNRSAFMERLAAALSRYQRGEQDLVCVLFMDLDRFKWVNDHLGHQAGDRLLNTFSERLCARFRQHDTIARLGGDEFAVLLEGLELPAVLALVQRIQSTYAETVTMGNTAVHVVASIGIAFVSARHRSADDVMGEADAAMYAAKHERTGSYCVFDENARARLVPVSNSSAPT